MESIAIPDTTTIEAEGIVLLAQASELRITTHQEYEQAGESLSRVARLVRKIKELFAEPKKKAFEAHKAITRLEATLLSTPEDAERRIKSAIGSYQQAEESRIRQEQARIGQEFRKQEEDRRIAEAETLAAAGHRDEAEALLELPVVAPVVEIERPKAAGVSTRRKWTFRITDETKINRAYLMPDEVKIRRIVTALGPDAEATVHGIEVLEDRIVSVRT